MPSLLLSHKYMLKRSQYRFMLPVRFRNPHNDICSQVWECLLDTGAHTSVIPEYVSSDAGHIVENGVGTASLDAAWGDSQETFHHSFVLEIMASDRQSVVYTIPETIFDCTTGSNHNIILGANNFLNNFRIDFDYPGETVELHW